MWGVAAVAMKRKILFFKYFWGIAALVTAFVCMGVWILYIRIFYDGDGRKVWDSPVEEYLFYAVTVGTAAICITIFMLIRRLLIKKYGDIKI